jgi:cytochrome c oxidase subunit III
MAAVTAVDEPAAVAPGPSRSGPSRLGVGTVVWLSSELMFFAGLFAAYFSVRSTNDVWPPDDVELATARTAVATVVLVASSLTMHQAVVAARRRRDVESSLRWLAATFVLGALFIGNQALEYAEAPFSISSHAYGSLFYLMTGFHGLHVLGGLAFMVVVAGVVRRGTRAPAGEIVDVCGYYWHFVDVVWVAMFTTVYVLQ